MALESLSTMALANENEAIETMFRRLILIVLSRTSKVHDYFFGRGLPPPTVVPAALAI